MNMTANLTSPMASETASAPLRTHVHSQPSLVRIFSSTLSAIGLSSAIKHRTVVEPSDPVDEPESSRSTSSAPMARAVGTSPADERRWLTPVSAGAKPTDLSEASSSSSSTRSVPGAPAPLHSRGMDGRSVPVLRDNARKREPRLAGVMAEEAETSPSRHRVLR